MPSRVWFITGTSTGLGKSLVAKLLQSGERVVATSRNPSSQASLTSSYSKDQLLLQKLDVTKAEEVKEAFENAVKTFGRVDVVVNNAGYTVYGEIEAIPEAEARQVFDVLFWGPVNVLKEAARVFREVNLPGAGGRVFSISSVGGYRANPTLSYYSAGKFALEGFTQAFLQEMSPSWNIKGCIIEPGGFQSEWRAGNAHFTPQHPAYTDMSSNPCAMFRAMHDKLPHLGDADKMAQAVITLADLSMGKDGPPKDLPLRVPLGTESLFLVKEQAKNTIREGDEWAWISHSTNMDGVDGNQYVRDILLASGNFKDAEV